MPRTLLVHADKKFRLTIPDDAKVTFGPWSPPSTGKDRWGEDGKRGTLRVYGRTKDDVLGVFSGVVAFRDISSLTYAEEVAKEVGATVWSNDDGEFTRVETRNRTTEFIEDPPPALPAPRRRSARKAR